MEEEQRRSVSIAPSKSHTPWINGHRPKGKVKGKKVFASHALKGQKILAQGVCVFRNKMKPSAPRIKERKASSFLENSERIAWGGHFTTKKIGQFLRIYTRIYRWFLVFLWFSLNFSDFLWFSLNFSDFLWFSLNFSDFLWISPIFSEFLYISRFFFVSLQSKFRCP